MSVVLVYETTSCHIDSSFNRVVVGGGMGRGGLCGIQILMD